MKYLAILPSVKGAYLQEEHDWLRGIARGDEAAFSAVFGAYKDRVYSIALRLTGSATLAEEIVQDVFLKLWLKREGLDAVDHFRAYLFTATRHHIFNALKRQARQRQLVGELGHAWPELASDTDALLLDKEYQGVLREAVNRLPERQQEVYRLVKEQGWKREKVAERLQIAPETVKVHLAQAMRSIRAFCLSRLDIYIALILFDSLHK